MVQNIRDHLVPSKIYTNGIKGPTRIQVVCRGFKWFFRSGKKLFFPTILNNQKAWLSSSIISFKLKPQWHEKSWKHFFIWQKKWLIRFFEFQLEEQKVFVKIGESQPWQLISSLSKATFINYVTHLGGGVRKIWNSTTV
jgi:hypothetical protein